MTRGEAVIIGAGVAGGVAAIRLAEAGWGVTLVERRTTPDDKVCGCCVHRRGWRILREMGVPAEIGRRLSSLALVGVRRDRRPRRLRLPWLHGRVVARSRLDAALLERAAAAGVTIRTGVTAEVRGGDGEVALSDGTRLSGDAVLVADGLAGGSLRGLPGWEVRTDPRGPVGSGTILPADLASRFGPPPGRVWMMIHTFGDGQQRPRHGAAERLRRPPAPGRVDLGLVRLPDGRLDLGMAVRRGSAAPAAFPVTPGAGAAEVLAMAGHPELAAATGRAPWRSVGRLTRRRARVADAGARVLVIGDAAGYAEPLTGEGMAWAAADGRAAADLLAASAADAVDVDVARAWTERARRRSRIHRACGRRAALARAVVGDWGGEGGGEGGGERGGDGGAACVSG